MKLKLLSKRLWYAQERSYTVKLLLVVGGIAGAITAVLALGTGIWRMLSSDSESLYSQEYRVLSQLKLGVRAEFLSDRLGEPAIVASAIRPEGNHSWASGLNASVDAPDEPTNDSDRFELLSFPRPGHVITALVDSEGYVVGMGISSCNSAFTGTFKTPIEGVVLNTTKMADLDRNLAVAAAGDDRRPTEISYEYGGSMRLGYYVLDFFSGDFNAYDYTDIIAGQFFLCGDADLINVIDAEFGGPAYHGPYKQSLDKHRRAWPINVVFVVGSDVPPGVTAQLVSFAEETKHYEE